MATKGARRKPELPPPATGERTRLSDQIYGRVFDEIVSGRYAVGDRLPTVARLHARMRASQ